MSTPKTMRAIKSIENGRAELKTDVPVPKLRDDYVLVKVSHVALNPTDWKHIDSMSTPNATVGCDYSGTVVELGPAVKHALKSGDRVCGVTHGVNALQPEDGCFGDYCMAKPEVQMKTPEGVSDEEAATLGVGLTTVGQGLYQSLGLPMPDSGNTEKTPVLVYGGSTATGLFALQFAKLSGLHVITTCSPRNNDLVKSYGADQVFDYNDPSCARKIRDYTSDSLQHVFDCISVGDSPKICAEALSSRGGGIYSTLIRVNDFPRRDVENKLTLAYTAEGKPLHFRGRDIPAKPEDAEFADGFWRLSEKLLGEGKIKIPPIKKGTGGLGNVFEGLDLLRTGKVSGQKIVYDIRE